MHHEIRMKKFLGFVLFLFADPDKIAIGLFHGISNGKDLTAPVAADVSSYIPGALHHVGDNRARCGIFACSSAVEHEIIHHVSMDEDSVEHILHAVQGMVLSHKERRGADAEPAVLQLSADAEELDSSFDTARIAEIN